MAHRRAPNVTPRLMILFLSISNWSCSNEFFDFLKYFILVWSPENHLWFLFFLHNIGYLSIVMIWYWSGYLDRYPVHFNNIIQGLYETFCFWIQGFFVPFIKIFYCVTAKKDLSAIFMTIPEFYRRGSPILYDWPVSLEPVHEIRLIPVVSQHIFIGDIIHYFFTYLKVTSQFCGQFPLQYENIVFIM